MGRPSSIRISEIGGTRALGDIAVRAPAEIPKLPMVGTGALTPEDITRVLADDSPGWAQLRRKLDRFRYCDTCDSWRSGVPVSRRPDDLECWICGVPMAPLAAVEP